MHYSHPCTYCNKIFYTFNTQSWPAAYTLYYGIKAHLVADDEDHKEYKMDDGVEIDTAIIYKEMEESKDPPLGGYELR